MPKRHEGYFGAFAGNRRQPWQSPRELSTQRQLGSSRDWSSPDCKGCAKKRLPFTVSPVQARLPAKSRDKADGKIEDDSPDCMKPSFAKLTRLPVKVRSLEGSSGWRAVSPTNPNQLANCPFPYLCLLLLNDKHLGTRSRISRQPWQRDIPIKRSPPFGLLSRTSC